MIVLFQSGAKINISDGSCPERIVTVTGTTNAIFKAFTLICKKFEEVRYLICPLFRVLVVSKCNCSYMVISHDKYVAI